MKKFTYFSCFSLIITVLMIGACEKVDYPVKSSKTSIAYMQLSIPGTDAVINPVSSGDTIFFDVPYHYPILSETVTDITKLKLVASIPNGATIAPALGVLNCTNPIPFTITSANGTVEKHVIVARLKKSDGKQILTFKFASLGLKGIVSDTTVTFVVLADFDLSQLAKIVPDMTISPRATITPSISDAQDFTQPVHYTLTAEDGTKKTYVVKKGNPTKLTHGVGYYTMLWKKTWAAMSFSDYKESSIAISGNYMVLNGSWGDLNYYNKVTTALVGSLKQIDADGNAIAIAENSQVCNDGNGHIIGCNTTGKWTSNGSFNVYTWDDVTAAPVLLISTASNTDDNYGFGRKLSVVGDIKTEAYLYSSMINNNKIGRWKILNGVAVSQDPEILDFPDATWGLICKSEGTGVATPGNLFVAELLGKQLSYYNNGSAIHMDTNWFGTMLGDVAYFEFNNAKLIAALDIENGANDSDFKVFDVSDITKLATKQYTTPDGGFYVMKSETLTGAENWNATTDVVTELSADGNSVYVYMLMTNGGIMKYELTNIDPASLN